LPTDAVDVMWFADAACTQGVDLRFANDGPPKTYLVVRPDDACAGPPKLYTRGGPLPLATFYTGRLGAGFAQSAAPTSASSLGDLVPLDACVAAREVVEDRGGRIASLALLADDGAREVISGYDTQRREPSWVPPSGWIGVSTPTWLPARFAWHYPSSL